MADVDPPVATPDEPTRDTRRTAANGAEIVWWVSLTVLFALVALGALAAGAAVWPASCRPCHSAQVAALEESSHASAHCDDCHAAGGMFALVDNRLSVAGMVPAQIVPGGSPDAKTTNEGCLGCHEDMIPQTIVSNGVRMNHRAPQDQGWLCTTCHPDVAHLTEDGTSVGTYTMETCLECHVQAATNVTGCATCHPEGDKASRPSVYTNPWQIIHGANWRSMHGMGDLDTCNACHATEYCMACHDVEMPHPEPFIPEHGALAVDQQTREACYECHEQTTCEGCHGVPMPHPSDFLPNHRTLVEEEGDEACERCHEPTDCDACHTRHAHPGLTDDEVRDLRQRPVYTP